MNRPLAASFLFFLSSVVAVYFSLKNSGQRTKSAPRIIRLPETADKKERAFVLRLQNKAARAKRFAEQKGLSQRYAFLLDMRLPSGRKRFFLYDLKGDSVVCAGLVAHGSCRSRFLPAAQFSNVPDCGCSSVGRYKIGKAYQGRFGTAFKLHGLDSSNSNAFRRLVVLHAYRCVPDEETYPFPICNSLGCPMVSHAFLAAAKNILKKEAKPVLLWIYN